ncbi:MAG: hypothetical protein ACFFB2_20355 [Promethearchaeota archaeon]
MKKTDNYLSTRIRRKIQIPASPRIETGIFCERCGKELTPHASYCVVCAAKEWFDLALTLIQYEGVRTTEQVGKILRMFRYRLGTPKT